MSTVVAALAVGGSAGLVVAPAATATAVKAPSISIDRVAVKPSPVVVASSKRKVNVTFSFVTDNATGAEAYLKAPAPGVETKLNVSKRNLGRGKVAWSAKYAFDRSAKPGHWNLRVLAKNSRGEKSDNKRFEVRQVWETGFDGFNARPREVRRGDSVSLTGQLRVNSPKGWQNLGRQKVHIAFRPFGGSWKRVDSTFTRSDGKFAERVRATQTGWYRAEYDGSKTTHSVKSRSDRVSVKRADLDTRISGFDVSPSRVEKGDRLFAKGTLLVEDGRRWDGLSGKRVEIQFKGQGDRQWRRVATDRTDRRGRFGERITAEATGWFRAVYKGDRGIKDTATRPDFVRVTEPKPANTRFVRFDAYPEPVKFGRYLKFRGKLLVQDGRKWVPLDRAKVQLYYKPTARSKWEPVRSTLTKRDGGFFLQVRALKSGWWKVDFAGTAKAGKSEAKPDHVRVVRR